MKFHIPPGKQVLLLLELSFSLSILFIYCRSVYKTLERLKRFRCLLLKKTKYYF